MAEYIEREAVHRLVRSLNRYIWKNPEKSKYRTTVDIDDVQFGIDKIPTADVVEVIRCKNCKNYELMKSNGRHFCNEFGGFVAGEDFCSRGAKMDGATDTNVGCKLK